jgi:O-antigen biosynthesis protein
MARAGLRVERSTSVRGWVEDDEPDQFTKVSLLVNGEPYWTGLPRRLEHLGFDPSLPRTACGIWVDLPFPTTSPNVLNLKLVRGDEVLTETTTDAAQRYSGFVDKIDLGPSGLEVEGWAHDFGRPLHSLTLEVRAGDRTIASFLADRHREDLAKNQIGLGNHAFSEVLIRSRIGKVDPDSVRVVIAGTEIALSASDTLIRQRKSRTDPAGKLAESRVAEPISLIEIISEPPEACIAGVVDKISNEEILGWALDLKEKDRPVVLDLLINNFVVATTRTDRYRHDIATKHECSGYAGFHFEIIPQMRLGKVLNVAVVARKTGHILPHGAKTFFPRFAKLLPTFGKQQPSSPRDRRIQPSARKGADLEPSVALIVLNKNGAALLDRHFQTFVERNTYKNVEYLVIDHGSTDGSKAIIEKWRSTGLTILFDERGENYSFSASNNYAVQLTKAEYLLFCNNDIFFTEDALPAFMQVLAQSNVGIAGIKLLDDNVTEEDGGPRLIQHLGVYYNTAKFDRVVHPVEARYLPILEDVLEDNFEVPAATGAFLGIKREDFIKLGGFCEDYFYGYEDIDLCLQVKFYLKKTIALVASKSVVHSRGYSRKRTGLWGGAPMLSNSALLSGRFGLALRRTLRSNLLMDHRYWTATEPIIAFAVTQASPMATAGDFYTAYELARELSKLIDAKIVFLEESNWYDVKEVDVLVAMTHNYDLSSIRQPKQNLVTVGWARNWFSHWEKPRRHQFDFILASSSKGAGFLSESLGHRAEVLRIATSPERFYEDRTGGKTVDYVFTGSFWGHPRDLMQFLEPAALPYSCEIYGAGWENVESFAPYAKGFVSYDQLPDIYRRARVVIDDANFVTKKWGSTNSRVFDAIAAGALPITNSRAASEDAFGGKLPYFETREELENLLHRFCRNEDDRVGLLGDLQEIVRNQHTYSLRAKQLISVVNEGLSRMFRIAIKVPCPSESEAHLWGDYHFAQSLGRELRTLGHSVRLDFLNEWNSVNRLRDDVVICLRGLSQYAPTPDQINICWLISHPNTVSLDELRQYDRVYVASHKYCTWLRNAGLSNVEVLLQCVDTKMFHRQEEPEKEFDVLFVGNSRNALRPIIRDAVSINAPLTVIGSGWDGRLPKRALLQKSVPHEELPRTYAKARVILNDHWDSMAEHGFISNRLFDCVALGAYVVSDRVEGISDVFGPLVKQYQSPEELKAFVEEGMRGAASRESDVADARVISEANSFQARAKTISDFITTSYEKICRERLVRQPTMFASYVKADSADLEE